MRQWIHGTSTCVHKISCCSCYCSQTTLPIQKFFSLTALKGSPCDKLQNVSAIAFTTCFHNHYPNHITYNMADGIDRKAEERMEFTTSKEVSVAPTFEQSKHNDNTSMTYFDISDSVIEGEPSSRHLRIRIRVAFSSPIQSHCTNLQRTRHNCAGAIRYRKDSHLLDLSTTSH